MLMRKLFRTMGIYKAQFLSMVIMLMLGMGIFVGFNVEWCSIENNTLLFLEETGYADYRIISTMGYSDEEAELIRELYGDDYVSRYLTFDAEIDSDTESNNDILSMTVTENDRVSSFLLTQGERYDASDDEGIWIGQKYALENNVELGDTISFTYNGIVAEGIVKGFIQSGEYMICLQDTTQIMPDYTKHGYAYISPKMLEDIFGTTFYNQIHVISSLDKAEFSQEVDETLGETAMIYVLSESLIYRFTRRFIHN